MVKYSAEYQVSFTLLVADPNDGMVDWPIAQALETISPLFTQLEHISNFSISSQVSLDSLMSAHLIVLFILRFWIMRLLLQNLYQVVAQCKRIPEMKKRQSTLFLQKTWRILSTRQNGI